MIHFKCYLSHFVFHRFHLSEHKNVHLDITPYSCGVCEKKFHRRIQLRQHKVVHNNESSYDCPQCGACFNRRGNMTQHMKRHLKERKFICKVRNYKVILLKFSFY